MLELINQSLIPGAAAGVLAAGSPLEHVVDHVQYQSGWAVVTNHMIIMCLAGLAMLIIFPLITRPYRRREFVPTGTRNFFEAIMLYIREDVVRPILGEQTDRFIPFLWTLFFFILFNNLIGLLPLEPLTGWFTRPLGLHPIYGTATANIYVTGTLAMIAFVVMQLSGIRANGPVNYAKHFLGGAPWYMFAIMIPVEFMGMLVKPCALAIRLFANMNAGHIMLAVLISFVAAAFGAVGVGGGVVVMVLIILGSVAIMCLELFVAFLQAYIFTFLTSLFIGQLVVHEHDEHHEEEPGHPHVSESHVGHDAAGMVADVRAQGAGHAR